MWRIVTGLLLPADAAARVKVLQTVSALLTAMGEGPVADIGQKHLFIALD